MYNRYDMLDAAVIKNRRTFLKQQGIELSQTTRVAFSYDTERFTRYHILSVEEKGAGMLDHSSPDADALLTTEKNHALFLPVADCIGAVIYDPSKQVLMMSHLGRHSLEQQGAKASVLFLVEQFHSDPSELEVWMTPAAGMENYPIWALDNKGMKEVALEQFQAAGIQSENITDNPIDTTTDKTYYSYSEFLKGNRPEDGDHAIVAMMTD